MRLILALLLTSTLSALTSTTAMAAIQNPAVGAWDFTTNSPEGTFTTQLEIRQEAGALVAVGKSPQGERAYDSIAVDGNRIKLVVTINYNGTGLTITYTGTLDGKEMSGDADFGGMASGSWSASRK
jgi:hypothetical protein